MKKKELQVIPIIIKDDEFLFLVEFLEWDSNYFAMDTYKIHTVIYENNNYHNLCEAVRVFNEHFFERAGVYCFIDIPSEDINLLQAFCKAKFKLIETRMSYYLDLTKFEQQRYSVRQATLEDIPNLRRVASEMRNKFDRFHADPVFDQNKADEFLATFIEESVKGFADYTIVPNEIGTPPDAFLTAKYLKDDWDILGKNVSKMVLSAVSSKTCKGWYKKLISEMAYHLKDLGAEFVFMHPASTNKAVIYTYENLGCRLGQVSHILSHNS